METMIYDNSFDHLDEQHFVRKSYPTPIFQSEKKATFSKNMKIFQCLRDLKIAKVKPLFNYLHQNDQQWHFNFTF